MFIKLPSERACHLIIRHIHAADPNSPWSAATVASLQFAWPHDKSYGPVHAAQARCVPGDRFVKKTGLRLAVGRVLVKAGLDKADRKAVWAAALPKLAARPAFAERVLKGLTELLDSFPKTIPLAEGEVWGSRYAPCGEPRSAADFAAAFPEAAVVTVNDWGPGDHARSVVWARPNVAAEPGVTPPAVPLAGRTPEGLAALRRDAECVLSRLEEHGDPLSGDDWSLVQVLRHYLELAAPKAAEVSAGKGESC